MCEKTRHYCDIYCDLPVVCPECVRFDRALSLLLEELRYPKPGIPLNRDIVQ